MTSCEDLFKEVYDDLPYAKSSGQVEGFNVLPFPVPDPVKHVNAIRNLQLRDDDVIIAAFRKCGTHWVWEIIQMLLSKKAVFSKLTKEYLMMEFTEVKHLDEELSPRVLNSHLPMAHLPQAIVNKKTKIIHVVRNPKDVAVSLTYHYKQRILKPLEVSHIIDLLIKTKSFGCSLDQFNYLRQIQDWQLKHPDHPVLLVYYEELHRNPVKTVKQISKFLGVEATDEFCEKVSLECKFSKMQEHEDKREMREELLKWMANSNGKMKICRKGAVGDWKNHFTVAENEAFENYIKTGSKDLQYKFIYEL